MRFFAMRWSGLRLAVGRVASAICVLILGTSGAIWAQPATTPASPQQRYEAARRSMQHGNYDEAAQTFQAVADAPDAPDSLRAQALVASGLMHENNRQYERAAEIYRAVQERFPGSEFARRARAALDGLEVDGRERGIAFRRRQDAAWDALFPAQAEAARGDWVTARPKLQQAAALLRDLLRDFPTHPKAKDLAIALGNTYMLMEEFAAARGAYEQALRIAQAQQAARSADRSEADSIVLDAEERLAESIRAARRQWMTRSAWMLLLLVSGALVLLRPWHGADAAMLRLGLRLIAGTLLLSLLAMALSYVIRTYIDPHSPIVEAAAGFLVAIPGTTAVVVVLGFSAALRATLRWSGGRAAGAAAVIGAVSALAAATCVVNAYALFPILDSAL